MRSILLFGILVSGLLAASAPGRAHPMGNFTINRCSHLTAARSTLRLRYTLDMAELPTITERQSMDRNDDGAVTSAEADAYLAERMPVWLSKLVATLDGKPLAWGVPAGRVVFTPGVANLATMRVEVTVEAPWPSGRHQVAYDDGNYTSRPGWKEIVVDAGSGVTRPEGADAYRDLSHELHRYPSDLLVSPPQVTTAAFTVDVPPAPAAAAPAVVRSGEPLRATPRGAARPAAAPARAAAARPVDAAAKVPPKHEASEPVPGRAPESRPAAASPAKPEPKTRPVAARPEAAPIQRPEPRRHDSSPARVSAVPPAPVAPATPAAPAGSAVSPWSRKFHSLVTVRHITPGILAMSLLIAMVLGALHALQPGHGKTLVAAYLVGQRGTARHALLLGLTVTISHTFGVFVLGLVALYASRYLMPEAMVPWMGVLSGVLIAGLGGSMLASRLRERTHGHGHAHPHQTHDHTHPHAHGHTHGHDHEHAGMPHSHGPFGEHTHEVPDRISLPGLLALGISGGIVPCWDALIVLLASVQMRNVWFGLMLIVAFSAGLAATLTAAGLAVVWGQKRIGVERLSAGRVRAVSIASHAVVLAIGLLIAVQSLASALPRR